MVTLCITETLPHEVGSSAIENVSSKFSYVPLKENWLIFDEVMNLRNPVVYIF